MISGPRWAGVLVLALATLVARPGSDPMAWAEQGLVPYTVVGDAIPASLTGTEGDVARGRAIIAERQTTCLLCHAGPFPDMRQQGTLAPDLAGAGGRWSAGQLRLRLVEPKQANPATIMPSFYRVEGLNRVGEPWRGRPILSAAEIEDVIAYLVTLRD